MDAARQFLLGGSALLAAAVAMPAQSTAQSLTTTFIGGNGFDGNMFDVQVLGGAVLVTGLDLHLSNVGSTTISLYTRPGSFVGFESDPAGWTLMSQNVVTSAGQNNQTFFDVTDFELLAGATYGFYVAVSNSAVGMQYTDGSGPYGTDVFENGDLKIITGVGKSGPDFTGTTFTPRIWNGTIYYLLHLPPSWTDEQVAAELTLQAAEQGVMLSAAQSRAVVDQLRSRMASGVVDESTTASVAAAFAADGSIRTETVFGYATGGSAYVSHGRWTAWADTSADGLRGDWAPTVTGYQFRQQFGLDHRFANGWIGGLGIGGGTFANDFANGGKLSGNAFWVQPYLGVELDGWLLALQAAYTYTRYGAFNTGLGINDSATGHRLSGSATVSREFALGGGFYVTPEASISAGSEGLSDLVNLSAPSTTLRDANFFNARLGAEVGQRFSPSMRAYAIVAGEYTSTSGDGAASYLSTGYQASRLSATLGGGFEVALGDGGRLGMEGRVRGVGSDTLIYGAAARLSFGF